MLRAKGGDRSAFAKVYALGWEPVRRAVESAGFDRSLAEDVAQETFVKLWFAKESYSPALRVLPWARTIARRTLIDVLRRRRTERAVARTLETAGPSPSASVDASIDARRRVRAVEESMRALPPSQARALAAVATNAASLSDVAKELGESPVALRLRVHRARAALRSRLGDSLGAAAP